VFAYHQNHPRLQLIEPKLAKWVAKNFADELRQPESGEEFSSEDLNVLNHILIQCLVSN
jgi:hypothetical protein